MHRQREPVGHARHVVDDLGDLVGVGVPVGLGDLLGVRQVVVDQPADDVDGDVLLPRRRVGHVDALEHERPQLVHRLERLRLHDDGAGGVRLRQRPADDGVDHRADHLRARLPEDGAGAGGQVLEAEHPRPDRVQRVVGEVADPVGVAHALALVRRRRRVDLPAVRPDAVPDLPGEVQVLERLDDPHALRRVVPAAGHVGLQRVLAEVAERRVAEVVAERDGLGEGLVEPQRPGQRPRHLGDLQRVGEPGDEVVAVGVQEDLRLVLEPAEGLGVQDPVAVALERRPERVLRFGPRPAAGPRPLGWPPARAAPPRARARPGR